VWKLKNDVIEVESITVITRAWEGFGGGSDEETMINGLLSWIEGKTSNVL
jgi:hypothetical protein